MRAMSIDRTDMPPGKNIVGHCASMRSVTAAACRPSRAAAAVVAAAHPGPDGNVRDAQSAGDGFI